SVFERARSVYVAGGRAVAYLVGARRRQGQRRSGRAGLGEGGLEVDVLCLVVRRVDVREILREHFHTLRLHFECVLLYSEIRIQTEWHDAVRQKSDLPEATAIRMPNALEAP